VIGETARVQEDAGRQAQRFIQCSVRFVLFFFSGTKTDNKRHSRNPEHNWSPSNRVSSMDPQAAQTSFAEYVLGLDHEFVPDLEYNSEEEVQKVEMAERASERASELVRMVGREKALEIFHKALDMVERERAGKAKHDSGVRDAKKKE